MHPRDAAALALRLLWRRRVSSSLIILGIGIAVGSFVCVISLIEGSRSTILGHVEKLGVNEFTIHSQRTVRGPEFMLDDADVEEVRRVLEDSGYEAEVEWVHVWDVEAAFEGGVLDVYSVATHHGHWYPESVTYGQAPNRELMTGDEAVCFVRATEDSPESGVPIGATLDLLREDGPAASAVVVGIEVRRQGASGVVLSEAAAEGLSGHVEWIKVKTRVEDLTAVIGVAEDALLIRAKSFSTFSSTRAAMASAGMVRKLGSLFVCGAAISAVAGSIAIINVMVTAVRQQVREIAVRQAEGARRLDIVCVVLLESVLQSAAGGCLGVLAGVGGSRLLAALLPGPFLSAGTPLGPALIGGCAALASGVVFAVWPAWRAASVDPAKALRYE